MVANTTKFTQIENSALRLGAGLVLALALGAGCAAGDAEIASAQDELIGGREAVNGQFPATVALMAPLAEFDTRYCIAEDRRCTMTRVGPRAYLAAGHCFADKDELENHQRVVMPAMFEPGRKLRLSFGARIWEYVEGTCPEQTFGGQLAVPAPGSKRLEVTVRKVHFHPSYLSGGAEAGQPGNPWTVFQHADVAILEVEEDLTDFAQVATISYAPLHAGDQVIIGGHGMSGGFAGTMWSGLKFARISVDAIVGADFFTRMADPFGGPGIAPGDSGGGVFLASDSTNTTLVGVNSKSMAYRGSAHVRLDDAGPQAVATWLRQTLAQLNAH